LKKHHFAREREIDRISGTSEPRTVSIPLSLITELLLDATKSNRTWLRDFADESIRIDSDLYEVLLAYQSARRTAA